MRKSLESQYIEARERTNKIFNDYYIESKYEIVIIWTLAIFAIGIIAALVLTLLP